MYLESHSSNTKEGRRFVVLFYIIINKMKQQITDSEKKSIFSKKKNTHTRKTCPSVGSDLKSGDEYL